MKVITRDEGADTAPAASPLDALAAQATAATTPAPDAGDDAISDDAAPAKPKLSNEQCLMMVIEMVRETLCKIAKVESPKTTMSNEVMQPLAEAWGDVLDKYGVDLSAAAGDFMTEIKAALVTVPVALAIHAGLRAEIKASKAAPKDTAPGGVLSATPVSDAQ